MQGVQAVSRWADRDKTRTGVSAGHSAGKLSRQHECICSCFLGAHTRFITMFPGAAMMIGSCGCARLRPRAGRASGSEDEVLTPVQLARLKLLEKKESVKFFSKGEVAAANLRIKSISGKTKDAGVNPDEYEPNSCHETKEVQMEKVAPDEVLVKSDHGKRGRQTTTSCKRKVSNPAEEVAGWRATAPLRSGA